MKAQYSLAALLFICQIGWKIVCGVQSSSATAEKPKLPRPQPPLKPPANTSSAVSEKDIIDAILGPNAQYDNRLRPRGDTPVDETGECCAVNVTVNILLRSISKIDDVNMEYSCQITFRESWVDERLRYDTNYFQFINLPDPKKIWRPDLFFANEKQGHFHDIVMPNVLLWLYPNGKILYSVRLSLVLSCQMALHYYPLDRQNCTLEMASYGYTTKDIKFTWKHENPVQTRGTLELPSFTLDAITTEDCESKTNTGTYSCLLVKLQLTRQFSYYLLQLYIPSYMLVIVSWVSFWLDKDAVPARVSLGVTTLLTMATQASGINSKLPPVSYTKAIDVWIGVCLTFIFSALLEFALVNYAARRVSPYHSNKIRARQRSIATGALDNDYHPELAAMHAKQRQTDRRDVELVRRRQHSAEIIEEGGIQMKPLFSNSDSHHQQSGKNLTALDLHIDPSVKDNLEDSCCKPSFLSKYKDRPKRIDILSRILFPAGFALFNVAYWMGYLMDWNTILRL